MDDLAKISDLLNELQATADRRLELLKDVVHLHQWGGTHIDWRNLVAKIAREIDDEGVE